MNTRSTKALVTGSSGFIGSAFHAAFVERGYDVTAIDIKDRTDALDFFRWNHEPFQIAVHAAGYIGGRIGIENSPLRMGTNAALDSLFFRWLELSGTKRAVIFSSSAAYPIELQREGSAKLLNEDDIDLDNPRLPDKTYGRAKIHLEQLAREATALGKEILTLRIMSSYGPTQSLDYPWPSFVERARKQLDPFPIWNTGTAIRDWIEVSDVVGATMALLDAEAFSTFNIGTGIGTSFNNLAEMMCDAAGYSPEFVHLLDKPQGVHTRVCNPAKMLQFYTPKVTLERGIEMAIGARV